MCKFGSFQSQVSERTDGYPRPAAAAAGINPAPPHGHRRMFIGKGGVVRRGLVVVRGVPRRPPTGYVAGGVSCPKLPYRKRKQEQEKTRDAQRTTAPPSLRTSGIQSPPSIGWAHWLSPRPTHTKIGRTSVFLHTKLWAVVSATQVRKCGIQKKESCAVRGAATCGNFHFRGPVCDYFISIWSILYISRINPRQRREQESQTFGFPEVLRTKRAKVMAFHPRHSRPDFFSPVK